MYGYIYETTNLINGKRYIGQKKSSKFLKEKYLGSGNLLVKAVNKYGKENFKVRLIEECHSLEELNNRETYWINYYNAVKSKSYYNLGGGGTGWANSFLYRDEDELYKIRSNAARKVYNTTGKTNLGDGMLNKHHSNETKVKMSKSHKGKHLSEETKRKLSEAHKGKSSSLKGRKLSDETKKKISESLKGNCHAISAETKDKISKALKGKKKPPRTLEHTEKLAASRRGIPSWNTGLTKDNNIKLLYQGITRRISNRKDKFNLSTKDIKGSLAQEIDRINRTEPNTTLDEFITDEFGVEGVQGLADELGIDINYVEKYFKDLWILK